MVVLESNLETYSQIPGFAAYKLFGLVKGFLPQGLEVHLLFLVLIFYPGYMVLGGVVFIWLIILMQGVEEDEKTRKKREKLEKKASRGKFVKTKARWCCPSLWWILKIWLTLVYLFHFCMQKGFSSPSFCFFN